MRASHASSTAATASSIRSSWALRSTISASLASRARSLAACALFPVRLTVIPRLNRAHSLQRPYPCKHQTPLRFDTKSGTTFNESSR